MFCEAIVIDEKLYSIIKVNIIAIHQALTILYYYYQEGYGTYFYNNGKKYVGEWKNDKKVLISILLLLFTY